MSNGMERILAERKRQVEKEGYTAEHDEMHSPADLVSAAACYFNCYESDNSPTPRRWPWEPRSWKPKDRIRNLERAGALYLAAADLAEKRGQHAKAKLHRQAAEGMGTLIDDLLKEKVIREEIEAAEQSEKRLDNLFSVAFGTVDPAMLDWIRIKFLLKNLKKGFSSNADIHGNQLSDPHKAGTVVDAHTGTVERELDFTLAEAKELVKVFGNEDGTITVTECDGHSGHGLYAHFEDMPEEGSVFLGGTSDACIRDGKSMGNQPIIHWRYRCIEGGREVGVDEEINLSPDHLSRWQIEGCVNVQASALPLDYRPLGDHVMVPIAWVNQRGCKLGDVPSIDPDDRFASRFACFSNGLALGFGETYLYGRTPNEVMRKIQAALEKNVFVFANACE